MSELNKMNFVVEGQLIVTDKGYKPVENILVGDKVLTHKGNYQDVVKITSRDFTGDIISLKINGCFIPIKISLNQLVYSFRGKKEERNKGLFSWVEASELSSWDMLVCSCDSDNGLKFTLDKYIDFLGNYMIFGFIDSKGVLTFNTENKSDISKSIINSITRLNLSYSINDFRGISHISVNLSSNQELFNLCESFGSKGDRCVPEYLINMDISLVRRFIMPFLLSNRDKNTLMFFRASSSLNLFLGYQRMLIRLNSFSNVYSCRSRQDEFEYFVLSLNKKELSRVGKSSSDVWFRNFHNAFFRIDERKIQPYTGKVFNISVSEDSSFSTHLVCLYN
jgi:hypothetical protein